MLITGIETSTPAKLIEIARRWVDHSSLSRSNEIISALADALEDSQKNLADKTEAAEDHERNWIEASDAACAHDARVLTWFSEKYADLADRTPDVTTKISFSTASKLASAEAESLGERDAPVTDADRVRVLRDFLSYRLTPKGVAEHLAAYLEEIEGAQEEVG